MCLYPLTQYRLTDVYTGEVSYIFRRPVNLDPRFVLDVGSLPCGKCVECLQAYSSEWANRCMLEASLHQKNCVIALTYAKSDGNLHRSDVQLFIKRLRKFVGSQLRFFYCGEYGKKGMRPHYHLIVFGWCPDDLVKFFFRDDHWVYKSNVVAKLWSSGDCWKSISSRAPGFISVEELNSRSAKYCAKYLQKLNSVPEGFTKPFTGMSLKPAIGLLAFKPEWFDSDHMYIDGKLCPIPRYFRRKFGRFDFFDLRLLRGQLLKSSLKSRRLEAKMRFGKIRVQASHLRSERSLPPPLPTCRADKKNRS